MLKKIFGSNKNKADEKPAVKQRNPNDAIFYCTIQKAGSRWVHNVMKDTRMYEYTGLETVPYSDIPDKIQDAEVPVVKSGTIATRLYIDYSTYKEIVKPAKYKTFYLTRDPRDITVSWYFSAKFSHAANEILLPIREKLNAMSEPEGFMFSINHLADYGAFDAQRSWVDVEKDDERIKIYKYETLVASEMETFRDIFNHCDIEMPDDVFSALIKKHSFKTEVKRDKGTEDKHSHLRKGISGDWRNYFDADTIALFKERTGDLLIAQGYEEDPDWTL